LTTRRYTDTDIRKFIDNGNWVYCVSVKDKFGDQGITGLIIINLVSETAAAIDTFLLSCRILGKNIEEQFLSNVIDKLFRSGINEVNAIYIPTHKNEQVNNFYEKNGFQLISTAANGMKTYKLMKESFNFVPSKIYKIKSHD
jgi:FkbH-like protein